MKPGQRGGPVPWCISFGAVAVHGWRQRPVVRAENQCLIELLTPDTIDMQPIMTGHTGSHQRSSRDASGPPGGTDKPCGDADGGTGAWLRCFIPNNLIIFNIITQPSWWSSSNLNQHVLVAEPLKVDHLIARWWDWDNKTTWSGLGWWGSATWCQRWLLNGGLIQAKSGITAAL